MRSRHFLSAILLFVFAVWAAPHAGAQDSTAPVDPSAAPAAPQPGRAPETSGNFASPAPGAPGAASAKPAAPASKPAEPAKIFSPQKQCVDDIDEFATELRSGRRPMGDAIVIDSNFLPTNQWIDVGVRTPYVDQMRFFAGLERLDGERTLLARQDVLTRRAVASDPLVRKRLLEADQTIVTLNIDDAFAGLWKKADLYLYTCGTSGSPERVSRITTRLSPYWFSLWGCAAVLLIAYLWIALALRRPEDGSVLRAFNPVKLTAGPDGKGSLSKFQILAFTLVVFGLILLFTLRTGTLTDLSVTILALLGINGLGATVAKGADAPRTALAPENKAWLLQRNWISAATPDVDTSKASSRDFFTTDGEFDVYRYQSFVFSMVVVFALIAAGVTQLSTFVIPETILGIVGLSQLVYIGGKLVTPTNMSDLNAAIADLRKEEAKVKDSPVAKRLAGAAGSLGVPSLSGDPAYETYKQKAQNVATLFTAATGTPVSAAALEPTLN